MVAEELKRPVSLGKAEATSTSRIRVAEGVVHRNVSHRLNQDQFDALVRFFPHGYGKSDAYFSKSE